MSRKGKVCYLQTSIKAEVKINQIFNAIHSEAYWTISDTYRKDGREYYLLEFQKVSDRNKFAKSFSTHSVYSGKSWTARAYGCFVKDGTEELYQFIDIDKAPTLDDRIRERGKKLTYRKALGDIFELVGLRNPGGIVYWNISSFANELIYVASILDNKTTKKEDK